MIAKSAGHVSLIGAGPGDPELLTVKAVRAIERAQVILHDDLAIEAVRAYARPETRIVAVGKRGGCASTPQSFIERLMIQEAQAGRRVARVKGGDPYLFGRGGEELATLRAAGIACEVIPGITAGLAAPAAIGVAVTHREHTQGVAFITGHAKPGGAEPDWVALARSGLTLVVYMGVANVERITFALIAGGLPATTAAAAIQNATRPDQRQITSTLVALPDAMRAAGIGSPAILVIGRVVGAASRYAAGSPAAQSASAAITDALSPMASASSIGTSG